jgi:hypothetical protein
MRDDGVRSYCACDRGRRTKGRNGWSASRTVHPTNKLSDASSPPTAAETMLRTRTTRLQPTLTSFVSKQRKDASMANTFADFVVAPNATVTNRAANSVPHRAGPTNR